MNKEDFIKECKKINIDINEDILNKLNKYKDFLIEWNKKFNLTTIIDEKEIYLKHFYDSIYLLHIENLSNKQICDFGTGAGFPGMVIAIIQKDSKVTLIESNTKKITFLEEVKKELCLNNVEIINKRAEIYGKENRELYDIVTCRAVSNLNIILELSVPLLKINGLFIPMKSNVEEEFKNSIEKSKLLGYDFILKKEYELPIEKSKRTILIYKKIKKTDLKFPRNYSIIKKSS